MNKLIKILKVSKVTNILINKSEVYFFLKKISSFFKDTYFYSKINFIKKNIFFDKKKLNGINFYHIKNINKKNSYHIYDMNVIKKNKFCSCLYYYNTKNRIYIKFSLIKSILNIKKKNTKSKINCNFFDIINNIEDYFLYFSNFIISNPFFLSYKNIAIFSKILYLYNKYKILEVYFFLILIKYERFFIQKIQT